MSQAVTISFLSVTTFEHAFVSVIASFPRKIHAYGWRQQLEYHRMHSGRTSLPTNGLVAHVREKGCLQGNLAGLFVRAELRQHQRRTGAQQQAVREIL